MAAAIPNATNRGSSLLKIKMANKGNEIEAKILLRDT
jgi:hypothetical protein